MSPPHSVEVLYFISDWCLSEFSLKQSVLVLPFSARLNNLLLPSIFSPWRYLCTVMNILFTKLNRLRSLTFFFFFTIQHFFHPSNHFCSSFCTHSGFFSASYLKMLTAELDSVAMYQAVIVNSGLTSSWTTFQDTSRPDRAGFGKTDSIWSSMKLEWHREMSPPVLQNTTWTQPIIVNCKTSGHWTSALHPMEVLILV